MPKLKIDINCDMGESLEFLNSGHDEALMRYISSVNIACGYHAGNEFIMRSTVKNAIKYNLKIGAHPGFDDKVNFGRKELNLSFEEIKDLVKKQVRILIEIAENYGVKLSHIKPHGALYNMSAKKEEYARAIAEAVFELDSNLILFGLSGSISISEGKKRNLNCYSEVFADRAYVFDGNLASREQSGSVFENLDKIKQQTLNLVENRQVETLDKHYIKLDADTICIHSDTNNALASAELIYKIATIY